MWWRITKLPPELRVISLVIHLLTGFAMWQWKLWSDRRSLFRCLYHESVVNHDDRLQLLNHSSSGSGLFRPYYSIIEFNKSAAENDPSKRGNQRQPFSTGEVMESTDNSEVSDLPSIHVYAGVLFMAGKRRTYNKHSTSYRRRSINSGSVSVFRSTTTQ